ncbi:MAG: hypothetical protein J6Q85_00275 [Clostridia bacterium]|nr:hypothetical protein [Clostridia bacterium]
MIKKFLLSVVSFIVVLALLPVILFGVVYFVFSLETNDYYESANWNCTREEFNTTYYNLYKDKLSELKELYDLEYEVFEEVGHLEHKSFYRWYLYNDAYTFRIFVDSKARLHAELYFYGTEYIVRSDYETQRNAVSFLNDFVNFAAYDSRAEENQFEKLYFECVSEGKSYECNIYHFDNFIGNVGYGLSLVHDGGYYYKIQKDGDLEKLCNHYSFEGLLKTQNVVSVASE